jgi:hypothetical protein
VASGNAAAEKDVERCLTVLRKTFEGITTKRKIGEGLCGKVTLTEDPDTQELVAIKTYNSPPTSELS